MTQEALSIENVTISVEEELDPGLSRCKNCGKVVPETMLCLYCGEPILFKMPEKE